jgi:hypothetical protein
MEMDIVDTGLTGSMLPRCLRHACIVFGIAEGVGEAMSGSVWRVGLGGDAVGIQIRCNGMLGGGLGVLEVILSSDDGFDQSIHSLRGKLVQEEFAGRKTRGKLE